MVKNMKKLIRRIVMGYAVIAICIAMSYIPIYSIPVLAATSLGTGVFMVFGTAYSLVVEKPVGRIMAPLFYPDKSSVISSHELAAGVGL